MHPRHAAFRPQPPITYTPIPAAPAPVERPEIELFVEPLEYQQAQAPAEAAPLPAGELPRTASAVPFMAVGGLTSLLVGLWLGLLHRRLN